MTQTLQRSDDGKRIELGPNEVVVRLSADDTDGAFSLLEYTAPPDGPSPSTHIHEETDEVIYVLDGELACTVDEESVTASAGDTVWIPRETPHSFEVDGRDPRGSCCGTRPPDSRDTLWRWASSSSRCRPDLRTWTLLGGRRPS